MNKDKSHHYDIPENISPLQNGKKTYIKILVTDEKKAFDFVGKAMLGKLDMTDYGFSVEEMFLSEERYKDGLDESCRNELLMEIHKAANSMIESINSKLK